MKSPPVEDMFAELESEDGDDHVLPRHSKVKIYYSRDELLALKDSPLVKVPQGMSPASEWFSVPSNDGSTVGHRSRQPHFMGDSIKDFSLTPTKGIKRGTNRGLTEHEDAERPFGRGLASSGRPRNPARRTDSGTPGRGISSEEITEQFTPERSRPEKGERNDRKDRPWLRAEAKDQLDNESSLMGRFAVKGALKLQTGEEVEKRTSKAADNRDSRESRFSESTSRRIAESTWRRTTSGNVERAPPSNVRRYGAHEEDHVPEWMMDEAPSGTGIQVSGNAAISTPAQSGLDEIAAYRQAMKEREEQLNSISNSAGRMPSKSNDEKERPPGLFSELTAGGRGRETIAAEKAHAASFLLPQAKAKNRIESVVSAVADPVTPTGKGSRFARFFDPSASPATSNNESTGHPPLHSQSPLAAAPEYQDSIADKTQGLAALLGIKPTLQNRSEEAYPAQHYLQTVPSHPSNLQHSHNNRPDPRPGMDTADSSSQSVDHMARLLGMLKTASAQPLLPASQPLMPATPTRDMQSPVSANISPNSGSRFLAAMLNGEKVKPTASPQAQSRQPMHDGNHTYHQPMNTPAAGPRPAPQAQPAGQSILGRPPGEPSTHRNLSAPLPSAPPVPVENRAHLPMNSPAASNIIHGRPPNMDMLPMPTQMQHHGQHRPMPRQHGAESTPAIQQQTQFWQLAGDLPRGMIPNHPMHMPGPPFPPVNMPPPPPGYGPYQHPPYMPNIPQMPPPPMMFNGGIPSGPPPQSMAPDVMSSNLMALLQNRPQA